MTTEVWLPVKNYEGCYEVSNHGRISSLITNTILRNYNGHGYYYIDLRRPVQKKFRVHRLIAIHFIPNPDNKPQVNHKDGNKLNNHVDNLEWATAKENVHHAFKSGLIKNKTLRGPKVLVRFQPGYVEPGCRPVIQLDAYGNQINSYQSISLAAASIGRVPSSVHKVLNSQRKTSGGYFWRYANN